jgi:hypothetical protein
VADIFISYASPDRDRARLLADGLERQGWSVWWDREIQPGRAFDDAIEEALNAARCVIVLWSNASVLSDWVKSEAAEAADKRILVPALIDRVKIPLQFRRFQAADLTAWTGAAGDAGFARLAASVGQLLGRSPAAAPPAIPPDGGVGKRFDRRWQMGAAAIAVLILAVVAVALLWNTAGAVDVPAVVGRSLDEAKGSIAAADLTTGKVTEEPSATSALGTVLRQEPPAGAVATKGTAVALVVAAQSGRSTSTPGETKSRGTSNSADPGVLDPALFGGLGLAVAFEVKELGLHVTFIGSQVSAAAAFLGGPTVPGGLVIRLDPGTALKAGLHAGDVITRIGQTPISSENDLRSSLGKLGPGVSRFTVKRGEQELVLEIECPGCRVEQ